VNPYESSLKSIFRGLFCEATDWNAVAKALKQARKDTNTDPSEAQKKSGNYAKGSFKWNGLKITLENPAGSTRRGESKDGKKWQTHMKADYGYVNGTESEADGDHIDVFIGPELSSGVVYIVDQVDPKTKKFDEHKCVLGCHSEEEAIDLYHDHYEKGWKGFLGCKAMTVEDFVDWVYNGKSSKPLTESYDEGFSCPDEAFLPGGEKLKLNDADAWDFVMNGNTFVIGQFGSHFDLKYWMSMEPSPRFKQETETSKVKANVPHDQMWKMFVISEKVDGQDEYFEDWTPTTLAGRVWSDSKVITFWQGDVADFRGTIVAMLKSIGQDVKDYFVADENDFMTLARFINKQQTVGYDADWKELARQQHLDAVIKRKLSSGGMGSRTAGKRASDRGMTPAEYTAKTTTSESVVVLRKLLESL